MGTRLLRQHYAGLRARVDLDLASVVAAWSTHRNRFVTELRGLNATQWTTTTRCTAWDAKDVVAHLVTADPFWLVSLSAARAGSPPTTALAGFDPSTSLEPLVASKRSATTVELVDNLAAGSDAISGLIAAFTTEDWARIGESPFGHLEARLLAMHALWDSWLHERDIFVPLGLAAEPTRSELLNATYFTLFAIGAQGGLLDDPDPVGPGLDHPVDVTLGFDDLEPAIRIRLDASVTVEPGTTADAQPAGSALELVERFAGRRSHQFDAIPDAELRAQCARAAQML